MSYPAAVDLIKKYEGCRLREYTCAANKPTIGYGRVIRSGAYPGGITPEQAEQFLREDMQRTALLLGKALSLSYPLAANQFQALLSFSYNLGVGWWVNPNKDGSKTGLRRALEDKRLLDVPGELYRWRTANGKPLLGLARRRLEEGLLFLT